MDWLKRAAGLRQWTRGGARAPHKPLLLLYALARFQEDPGGGLRYSAVEDDLRRLLAEYGPPHRTTPAYPFHHLVGDGLWEVQTDLGGVSPGTGVRALRESGATGRLVPELRQELRREPGRLGELVRLLLDAHFPPSLHEELSDAVGLMPTSVPMPTPVELDGQRARYGYGYGRRQRRDPRIRERVLAAYDHRCAFCGFDGSLGTRPVGLEAAHVRWWAFEGPDALDNALCLCALHHKLFDKGVLGMERAEGGHQVLVSPLFDGSGETARLLVRDLAGRPLTGPRPGVPSVADGHRDWHRGQVFRAA
ncbi:phosphorothioated DNA-binding restriction endonuclease [Streptomyces sp. NPDC048290]|uniref:phosphorothioated DNA-binding restriction endonuclease n=1 Tax=Streptomyces sp. NPDC048290 TaxID=3155811 RepID=UPI00344017F6